jgi:hypothetical protein
MGRHTMIAAGNIKVPALYTGNLTIDGLDFLPRIIAAASSCSPTTGYQSFGLGLNSPDGSEGSHFLQVDTQRFYTQTDHAKTANDATRIAMATYSGPAPGSMRALILSRSHGQFILQVVTNTLDTDSLISWIATD